MSLEDLAQFRCDDLGQPSSLLCSDACLCELERKRMDGTAYSDLQELLRSFYSTLEYLSVHFFELSCPRHQSVTDL
jgi:hypothetical protein